MAATRARTLTVSSSGAESAYATDYSYKCGDAGARYAVVVAMAAGDSASESRWEE